MVQEKKSALVVIQNLGINVKKNYGKSIDISLRLPHSPTKNTMRRTSLDIVINISVSKPKNHTFLYNHIRQTVTKRVIIRFKGLKITRAKCKSTHNKVGTQMKKRFEAKTDISLFITYNYI